MVSLLGDKKDLANQLVKVKREIGSVKAEIEELKRKCQHLKEVKSELEDSKATSAKLCDIAARFKAAIDMFARKERLDAERKAKEEERKLLVKQLSNAQTNASTLFDAMHSEPSDHTQHLFKMKS